MPTKFESMIMDQYLDRTYGVAEERPPLRIDITGVGDPSSMPEDVGPSPDDVATQMAAGTEPEGATPMTLGQFAATAADVPAGLLKGGVQGSIGLPGDIISIARGIYDLGASGGDFDALLSGMQKPTGLPTTEDLKKFLDETLGVPLVPKGADPRRAEAAKTAEFVGEIGGAGETMVRGTKAAARAAGEISREMATTPPRGSVQIRPTPVQTPAAVQAPRSGLGFYSAVEETVANLPQAKGSGQQLLAQIQKTSGVKPEEIKYTGLDDFLKGKKSVTKTEIQDYLNANRVDVQEVRLDRSLPVVQAERRGAFAAYDRGEITLEQRNAILEQSEPVNTRHHLGAYQGIKTEIPGGENYRELLLTLPFKEPAMPKGYQVSSVQYDDGSVRYFAETPTTRSAAYKTEAEAQQALEKTASNLKDFRASQESYRSTHFDQPNILAHIRVNDRTVDGKKTLFIEEIQSDWHQAGRKKGYATENISEQLRNVKQDLEGYGDIRAKAFVEYNPENNTYDVFDDALNYGGAFPSKEGAQAFVDEVNPLVARLQELEQTKMSGVPDAPFKTTWHELTLKRAIQEASEKGYDQIAFTTGKTQAERYDLSKQVDELFYWQDRLIAAKNQKSVFDKSNVSPEQLENFVGKDVAKKLLESKPDNVGARKLFGEDLQVGGEGMKGFYDNILPKSLDKLGKKFDAKVGKTQMDGVEVWQMDITPKMRESVTTKGQPLFAVPAAAAAGAATMQQPEERM